MSTFKLDEMAGSVLDKPITNLKALTLFPLAGKLTLLTPKLRDWRGVATFVGFTGYQVNHLQQYQESGWSSFCVVLYLYLCVYSCVFEIVNVYQT